MTVSAEALQLLHRIHQQLADLRTRLERGPRLTAAADAAVTNLRTSRDEVKAKLQRARMAADAKQLQLKEREARVEDLGTKLNACNSNREYQALKEQIAADEQANSVLADEILEALEANDELEASLAKCEQHLASATVEADAVRKKADAERASLEAEIVRAEAELAVAEEALPADFRIEYRRIAKVRGEETLAPVEGEYCGGCNQQLSPQTMNELYLSKPVFCKSCGALLYIPESRSL